MENTPKIREHLTGINKMINRIFPNILTPDFCLEQTGQQGDYDSEALTQSARPLHHLISLGGKRWRPLALTLSAESLGVPLAKSLPIACLVELVHNGSLIVDDIEDSSPLRRGRPAAHTLFGEGASINIANHAYFMASVVLEQQIGPLEQQLALFSSWARALRALHIGQGLDIAWHQNESFFPSVSQYLTMCRMKTGALSRLSGKAACILSGQYKENFLADAWQEVGVGFQILDDVKNLTTGIEGKIPADDLVEGKKSLPIILAADLGSGMKKQLIYLLAKIKELTGEARQDMIRQVLDLLNKAEVLEKSAEQGFQMLRRSAQKITLFLPKNEASDAAAVLLENLIRAMA